MRSLNKILVITNSADLHADAVIHALNKRGAEVVRWHPGDLNDDSSLELRNDKDEIAIGSSGRTFSTDQLLSCWYRRPDHVRPHSSVNHIVDKHLGNQEGTAVAWGIYGRLRTAWYSHPYAIRAAAWKLFQLDVAKRIGLQSPEYVVSNRRQVLGEFASGHDHLVLKPIHENTTAFDIDGQPMNLYVKKLNEEDLEVLWGEDLVGPCFLQEYVVRLYDVRITVIGRLVFSVKILQPSDGEELPDWRPHASDLDHEVIECPTEIREKILRYNLAMGLNFSAFDFIVDRDGKWLFLECNPNGQWLWIEIKTGLNLVETFVEHLLRVREPLVPVNHVLTQVMSD